MTLDELILQAHWALYRFGHYALTNLVDDPAILAILFC
jgi:hypothetical protein